MGKLMGAPWLLLGMDKNQGMEFDGNNIWSFIRFCFLYIREATSFVRFGKKRREDTFNYLSSIMGIGLFLLWSLFLIFTYSFIENPFLSLVSCSCQRLLFPKNIVLKDYKINMLFSKMGGIFLYLTLYNWCKRLKCLQDLGLNERCIIQESLSSGCKYFIPQNILLSKYPNLLEAEPIWILINA